MAGRLRIFALAAAAALGLAAMAVPVQAQEMHGLSAFGDLKYPADFKHFDYVNPDAPKGGTMIALDSTGRGVFDSLNPFIVKGTPAAGLERGVDGPPGEVDIYFESLMARAMDTQGELYGLVARSAELGPERQWVIFHLRPEARFHDGTPIRAGDVVFSFETLLKDGHPRYRLSLRDIEKVEALDPLTVKYTFHQGALTRDLPLVVATLPILSKTYYQSHDFTASTLEPPLASGPYRIADVQSGRSITYERDPNYWGKDLPVNVGRYNFDRVTFQYYRDRGVALEAFKAGAYSYREEFTSKSWATEYTGPPIARGWIKRHVFDDNRPSGVQAQFYNTRREKLSDPRVREALTLAFDFEWTNKAIFYGLYTRMDSIWENTDLEARGAPGAAELKLLEPYRDQLPPEVFTSEYKPPVTNGSGNNRPNLREAAQLLRDAGWQVANGTLQKDGKPFTLEILEWEPSGERYLLPWVRNLETLGIKARLRLVDSAQFQSRLDGYDFDITGIRYIPGMPPGPETRESWGSEAADASGTYNLSGVKSAAADDLIERIIGADSEDELATAAKALDRVIMWGHYFMPTWRSGKHFAAWWDRFSRPEITPRYEPCVIDTWWFDKDKANALQAAMKGAR
jgi:microcin C transport system substrate-binding protein